MPAFAGNGRRQKTDIKKRSIMTGYVRFDRAMKCPLRDKAGYGVLESLPTTLLGERITIRDLSESGGNWEEEYDKHDRVDMPAEDSRGILMLMEVQNNNEYACFRRMLSGVSKLVTEYVGRGEGYESVRKAYGINIVCFAPVAGGTSCAAGRRGSAASARATFWSWHRSSAGSRGAGQGLGDGSHAEAERLRGGRDCRTERLSPGEAESLQ